MNKYRGQSSEDFFTSSRDPEGIDGLLNEGLDLSASAQDIPLTRSPSHDRVRVEKNALRQDFGSFDLGNPAPFRTLALGEHRFVRLGPDVFEKIFRLYRDGSGFPVIESWNGTAWVFEVTTTEFTVLDVLLSWKSYFNAVFFADGEKVFKWDLSNELIPVGNDFPSGNSLSALEDETSLIVTPGGAYQNKHSVNYSLELNGPTISEGLIEVAVSVEEEVVIPGTDDEGEPEDETQIQLVEIETRAHKIPASVDGGRNLSIEHQTINFTREIQDGKKVFLSIKTVNLPPVLRTNVLSTNNPPNGHEWQVTKTPAGIPVEDKYTFNFFLDDFENTEGSAEIGFYADFGEGLVQRDVQTFQHGRHTYEIFENEPVIALGIRIESHDPGVWRFFNNDSDPVGAVFVQWQHQASFSVHGFNREVDHDPTYGLSYRIEGEPRNDLILVRDQGDFGEIIVGRYLGVFADRIIVLIADGDKQKIRWCVRGDPTDWVGDGADAVILPSNSDPVDDLQALEPLTSDIAVLFRKRSKMRVLQTGQINPALAFFNWIEKLGTESPFSVIVVPGGLMYFGSNKQVYFLTEGGDTAVGQNVYEDFLRSPELELVEAVYDPDDQEYILTMAQGEDFDEILRIVEGTIEDDEPNVNEPPPPPSLFDLVVFSDVHSCTPAGDAQQYAPARMVDFVSCNDIECGGPGGWLAWWSNNPAHHPDHPDNPLAPYK